MDFKVIFTDTFLEDLERIVVLIARHNPKAAERLGELIIRKGESLSFFPERFPKVRQRRELRRYVVGKNYKVFYRVHHASKTVEIVRCWDGRRESDPLTSSQ